jgi:hypothetical protein
MTRQNDDRRPRDRRAERHLGSARPPGDHSEAHARSVTVRPGVLATGSIVRRLSLSSRQRHSRWTFCPNLPSIDTSDSVEYGRASEAAQSLP